MWEEQLSMGCCADHIHLADHTDMLTYTFTAQMQHCTHAASLQTAGPAGVSNAGKATLLQADIECTFSELPGCSGVQLLSC